MPDEYSQWGNMKWWKNNMDKQALAERILAGNLEEIAYIKQGKVHHVLTDKEITLDNLTQMESQVERNNFLSHYGLKKIRTNKSFRKSFNVRGYDYFSVSNYKSPKVTRLYRGKEELYFEITAMKVGLASGFEGLQLLDFLELAHVYNHKNRVTLKTPFALNDTIAERNMYARFFNFDDRVFGYKFISKKHNPVIRNRNSAIKQILDKEDAVARERFETEAKAKGWGVSNFDWVKWSDKKFRAWGKKTYKARRQRAIKSLRNKQSPEQRRAEDTVMNKFYWKSTLEEMTVDTFRNTQDKEQRFLKAYNAGENFVRRRRASKNYWSNDLRIAMWIALTGNKVLAGDSNVRIRAEFMRKAREAAKLGKVAFSFGGIRYFTKKLDEHGKFSGGEILNKDGSSQSTRFGIRGIKTITPGKSKYALHRNLGSLDRLRQEGGFQTVADAASMLATAAAFFHPQVAAIFKAASSVLSENRNLADDLYQQINAQIDVNRMDGTHSQPWMQNE